MEASDTGKGAAAKCAALPRPLRRPGTGTVTANTSRHMTVSGSGDRGPVPDPCGFDLDTVPHGRKGTRVTEDRLSS